MLQNFFISVSVISGITTSTVSTSTGTFPGKYFKWPEHQAGQKKNDNFSQDLKFYKF